jgi:flagellar FliJ protein
VSKSLKALIRYRKFELDERRRELRALEDLAAQIDASIVALDQEVMRERQLAANDMLLARYWPTYSEWARGRRDELVQNRLQVGEQILKAEDAVTDAYRELKKFEVAEANRLAREKAELDRKDRIRLDEIAEVAHQRKIQ